MSLEAYKITYDGFEPRPKTIQLINNVTDRIFDQAPYGSFLRLHLQKQANGTRGLFSINSVAGHFEATTLEQSPETTVKKLASNILVQLRNWKKHRLFDFQKQMGRAG